MTRITVETIRKEVQNRADEIIDWLKTLVRFRSENRPPGGEEGPAQEFIADECSSIDMEVDIFAPDEVAGIQDHSSWLPGRNYGNRRKNVVGRWNGNKNGRSLLLSGHVDVAPFEPGDWPVCQPFEPVIKNGRMYGRGTADMKGGLAAAFWALRLLRDLGFQPAGDILFESVVDEEFASGNGTLAARMRGHNADIVLVPEPTQMEICPACLGGLVGELTIIGKSGIPFTGHAIPNPITGAARAVELFGQWERKWRSENSHPLFKGPGKELKIMIWKIDSTLPGQFTQMGMPLQVNLSWAVWCYPGTTEDEILQRLMAYWQKHAESDPALRPFKVALEKTFHFVRPWETSPKHPAVKALVRAFRDVGGDPVISGAPISCDLGIYGEFGKMPAVLLGPRCDNLHATDEWVEIRDIISLTEIFACLALFWCGTKG